MSVSNAIPPVSQESLVDQLNDEEKNIISNYFRVLIDHLNCSGISTTAAPSDGSAGKLSKLSPRHLMELASDMCDELDRRDMGSSSPLPSKQELTTKRNNARIRMADFNGEKLNSLILDVVQEIDRRDIITPAPKQVEEDIKKRRASACTDSTRVSHPIPINSKKSKAVEYEVKVIENVNPAHEKNTRLSGGMCSGIDSLNAMIEDLGSLIDSDGGQELDELREKYEAEILNLKQLISKYESTIIPEKNREISKLLTRIEETELINTRLRKELSSLNDQLSCQETVIQDQKQAYEALKEALDGIQHQISSRVINTNEASRNAVRNELATSSVFTDLATLNGHIASAIGGIEDCLSNFNQKVFLKLLRDIATSSKSFVIIFDKVLQFSQPLNFQDMLEEGEKLKSEYISALSSVLVSGKDFSVRPDHCSDFKNYFENFKYSNDSLYNLKTQFESVLAKI
jgi:ribosomal protein S20